MNLNVSLPLNAVSLGAVGYNILKELYAKGISPNLFPIGNIDLSSFPKATQDFQYYLQSCANKALKSYRRDYPGFRLWHIQGSETTHSNKQSLLTFYECDSPTVQEINILNNQAATFVSSNFTKKVLEDAGVKNVVYCQLGYDTENYFNLGKPHPYQGSCVVFQLAGKWEPLRKNSAKTLALWARHYGNNPKYRLNVHVYNTFLHPDPAQCAEANKQLLAQALGGKNYWNINILNTYFRTSTELNNLYNSADIVLELGGNEGLSLPSYHTVGLGKHMVALNSNGVADWATEENAVLVQPSPQKVEAHDGQFFQKGHIFNQGSFFTYDENEAVAAMEKAVERFKANSVNEAGLKLQQNTWAKTVDTILQTIN